MAQKWNLQDIRPASSVRTPAKEGFERRVQRDIAPRVTKEVPEASFDDSDLSTIDIIDGNEAKRTRVIITSSIAGIIIILGVVVNIFLGGADVTIHPKVRPVSVQADFTTYVAPQVDQLGYELLKLEATGEKQVKASGKETVSEKAQGKIFVYNTKSSSPQRLITNTRFESANGLIYRIKDSIEVPGATKDSSGKLIPGKVVTDVFADASGEKYNLQPGKFTVPGLKGSEQYDSVYAESTAAFTGGFEGEKYIIDDSELSTSKQALHIELRDKLLTRLQEEKPAGFVAYPDAVTFVYESLPSTEYGDSLATIKETARLQIPLFKEAEFAKFIAEKSIPDYNGEDVTLTDPLGFTFTYTSASTSLSDISSATSLEYTLQGTTKLVWKFDEQKIKSELISKKKTDATNILGTYNSISNAQAEIRPFWKSSYPDSVDKIKIITIIDDKQ